MAHQHERSVTLGLDGHLNVSGKVTVPDGTTACAANTRIKIQRYDYSWKTVTEVTTSSVGSYSTALRDRRGRYRAVAVSSEVGATYPEHLCLKSKSSAVTHRH